jgi:hypothetical protein
VAASPLRHASGATLPPLRIERVGYVPVDAPTAYYRDDGPAWARRRAHSAGQSDGWEGEWPDPLIPSAEADVPADRNQPFWFTAAAASNAAPGVYRGEVRFESEGEPPVAIPVSVRVLAFEIPVRPRLQALLDLRRGPGGDLGSGIDDDGLRRKAWLRFLADHRVGLDRIEPAPVFTRTNGVVRMDATAFDREAAFCMDELNMAASYTPGFFYAFGWAYPPHKLFGLDPLTPEYDEALKQSVKLFDDHLRARGWADRFVYYISDEPHFDHDFVRDQMKRLCATIHASGTKLPIYSSTWRHCPEWDDSLDLWGVGQYGCFPVAEMERLRTAGKGLWITCDGQMAIDTPYLATERLLPYYCFKYGARGYEFWGVSWWTYDPWKFGWHSFISQSDDGKTHYFVRYPDGDGYLAYPGGPVGVEGPVSSIRMEQVREGLEDYEAIRTLQDLATKAGGARAAAAARALDAARALVTIPNAGGLRSLDILPDPAAVARVRHAVNEAIADLQGP